MVICGGQTHAIVALLASPDNRVQAFLAAGHVCTVMGWTEEEPLVARHAVPIAPTGFEPLDIVQGILLAVRQLEAGRAEVENQYIRSVQREGNAAAQAVLSEVFEVCDRTWRGIDTIPRSGLRLRGAFAAYDAERRFPVHGITAAEPGGCISGLVLRGQKKPGECPVFATRCTPEHPQCD